MDSAALPKVFEGFYEAAFEPEQWRQSLSAAAAAIGAAGVSLMPSPGLRLPTVHPVALDEMAASYFDTGWFRHNDRFAGCLDFVRRGKGAGRSRIMTNDTVFVDDPKMTGLAIQEDFFRRHGLRWFAGSAPLLEAGEHSVFLSVDRFERQGRFSTAEIETIDLITQHLKRSLEIMLSIDLAGCAHASDALGRSGRAAIYLGRDMRVVALNERAEAMLGQGVRVTGGRLAAIHAGSDDALRRAVGRIASSDFTQDRDLPGPVAIARRVGRPLVAFLAPVRAAYSDLLRNASVLALIVDPDEASAPPDATVLRDIFGLSPAEARLASALAAGASLDACARTFGVSYATVRNQLGSVFAKVGVKRQTELVALVLRLSDPIGHAPD